MREKKGKRISETTVFCHLALCRQVQRTPCLRDFNCSCRIPLSKANVILKVVPSFSLPHWQFSHEGTLHEISLFLLLPIPHLSSGTTTVKIRTNSTKPPG